MKKLIVIFSLIAASVSHANIICKAMSTSSGEVGQIEITEDNQVIVTGGFLHQPHVFKNVQYVNGLWTAPGLAVTMRNEYGCLRHAVAITEFREPFGAGYMETVNMGICSGGSTPDVACHAP